MTWQGAAERYSERTILIIFLVYAGHRGRLSHRAMNCLRFSITAVNVRVATPSASSEQQRLRLEMEDINILTKDRSVEL